MQETKEEWRDINGYDGLYQVSSTGRVKSFWFGKEHIIKQGFDNYGYLKVTLCKNKNKKTITVHRLVANTFINNPLDLREINHIDENKQNNNVDNLEWCTPSYNVNYGNRNNRASEKLSMQVSQYLNGVEIHKFKSMTDIGRQLGFSQGNISECCNGKRKTAYGYEWKFSK